MQEILNENVVKFEALEAPNFYKELTKRFKINLAAPRFAACLALQNGFILTLRKKTTEWPAAHPLFTLDFHFLLKSQNNWILAYEITNIFSAFEDSLSSEEKNGIFKFILYCGFYLVKDSKISFRFPEENGMQSETSFASVPLKNPKGFSVTKYDSIVQSILQDLKTKSIYEARSLR
jgi:hypothetical protein